MLSLLFPRTGKAIHRVYSTTDVMVRFSPILYRLTPRYLLYIRVNRVECGTGIKPMDLDSSYFSLGQTGVVCKRRLESEKNTSNLSAEPEDFGVAVGEKSWVWLCAQEARHRS